MAKPKSDIFSRFVFNNIMALSFKYGSPFFWAPYPPLRYKSFIINHMQFHGISPISCNPLCFHLHDGKHRNHRGVKAPISSRQKAPLLIAGGTAR